MIRIPIAALKGRHVQILREGMEREIEAERGMEAEQAGEGRGAKKRRLSSASSAGFASAASARALRHPDAEEDEK